METLDHLLWPVLLSPCHSLPLLQCLFFTGSKSPGHSDVDWTGRRRPYYRMMNSCMNSEAMVNATIEAAELRGFTERRQRASQLKAIL
jgi:hypothetical protein